MIAMSSLCNLIWIERMENIYHLRPTAVSAISTPFTGINFPMLSGCIYYCMAWMTRWNPYLAADIFFIDEMFSYNLVNDISHYFLIFLLFSFFAVFWFTVAACMVDTTMLISDQLYQISGRHSIYIYIYIYPCFYYYFFKLSSLEGNESLLGCSPPLYFISSSFCWMKLH
jgi:hypothetical protein